MNLEDFMLSEINQSEKNKYCMILLTWGSQSNQINTGRKEKGSCQSLGEGWYGELVLNGYRVWVWEGEKVLGVDDGDSCPTVQMYLMQMNSILRNG